MSQSWETRATMDLTPDEITAMSDAIVRAVRECQAILIAAARRPTPATIPSAPSPMARPEPTVLTRKAAAEFLQTAVGYPVSVSTLEKLAVTGGGPPFQSFGRRVVYRPDDLRAWAAGRARRRTSTSDPGSHLPE